MQHIALATGDIISTVKALRDNDVSFLRVPKTYYDMLPDRVGKIAEDQHLPVIAKNPAFRLAATVSQRGLKQEGVPSFRTTAELYAAMPEVDVVSICTPPGVR